jgi:predicted Fe-S protein YdhL (DUF1289 family)
VTKPENTDAIWKRAEIESPCIKTCVIHSATRLCIGCKRSIDEISTWGRMTGEERSAIMAALPGRDAAPKGRRGGRAARLASD